MAPESPVGYKQMGNLRLSQQKYGDAEKSYQQALDRDPSSGDALGGLMNAYLAQQKPDKAIAAVNAQIAKVPNSSPLLRSAGLSCCSITRKIWPGPKPR